MSKDKTKESALVILNHVLTHLICRSDSKNHQYKHVVNNLYLKKKKQNNLYLIPSTYILFVTKSIQPNGLHRHLIFSVLEAIGCH